jgi:hypothetical protein
MLVFFELFTFEQQVNFNGRLSRVCLGFGLKRQELLFLLFLLFFVVLRERVVFLK